MPILEKIRNRYPVEETLAFAMQQRSFSLSFSGDFSRQEIEDVHKGIEDLALRPVENGERSLVLSKADDGVIVLSEEGRESFSFPARNDQFAAIRWAVYGLVTAAPWISRLEGKNVCATLFNSDQQIIAASILDATDRWQNGEPDIRQPLESLVFAMAGEFVRKGPRLALRPVGREVWDEFDYTLLPTKRSMEGRDFLIRLYGNRSFEKEIEDYTSFVKSTLSYEQALAETEERICGIIYRQPISGLKGALHTVQQDIVEACREKLPDKPSMRAQIQFSKLTGDSVRIALNELNSWYEKYLELKVVEGILADIVQWFESVLQNEIYKARMAIQDINNELRSFCVVKTNFPRLDIGWEQSFAIDERYLRQQHTVWTDSMLFDLQMQGSYRDLWLMNSALIDSVQIQYRDRSYEVSSLSRQTLVVLRGE